MNDTNKTSQELYFEKAELKHVETREQPQEQDAEITNASAFAQITKGGRKRGIGYLAAGLTTLIWLTFMFMNPENSKYYTSMITPALVGIIFTWAGIRRILRAK